MWQRVVCSVADAAVAVAAVWMKCESQSQKSKCLHWMLCTHEKCIIKICQSAKTACAVCALEHIAAMSMTNICKRLCGRIRLMEHPKFSIELSINSCAIKCRVCVPIHLRWISVYFRLFAYLALAARFVLSNNDVDREYDDARVIYRNYSHISIDQLPTHFSLGALFFD